MVFDNSLNKSPRQSFYFNLTPQEYDAAKAYLYSSTSSVGENNNANINNTVPPSTKAIESTSHILILETFLNDKEIEYHQPPPPPQPQKNDRAEIFLVPSQYAPTNKSISISNTTKVTIANSNNIIKNNSDKDSSKSFKRLLLLKKLFLRVQIKKTNK